MVSLKALGAEFQGLPVALMGYMAPDFTTIRRFVAWFSVTVLGVASWLPAEEMIRTGADGRLEHAAGYLISGLAIFTAYPQRPKWLVTILMTYYAAVLEFGQLFVPGREAAISDWASSSGGVLCALFLYDAYQRVYASKSLQEYAEATFDRRS